MNRTGWPLLALLGVGFLIRATVLWTQTYVVFLDETFQYFEQAHRLAFGNGVLPWEFLDGIRSWFLPGLIAGLMRLTTLVTDEPLVYVRLTRLLCAAMSLVVVWTGYRMAERREGHWAAIMTGGICAVWFDLIWLAPAVLTEVLATHAALLALCLGDDAHPRRQRRLLAVGACFGLAFCLRYQYAPALLVAVLAQYRLRWACWRPLILGGLAVALPLGGGLDWLTWGAPFQSMWMNFIRNSIEGMSSAIGTDPPGYYLSYLWFALRPAPLLAALIVIGGFRAPVLGLTALVTLVEHLAVPHKEVRFIYLTLAIAPILLGLGCATAMRVMQDRFGRRAVSVGVPTVLVLVTALSWTLATSPPFASRWEFERASLTAFAAARAQPDLCALAVRDTFYDSGGYTYLHRDVPVYFADYDPARVLPGTTVTMRLLIMRHGAAVPQYPGAALAAEQHRYNYLIAEEGHGIDGFTRLSCANDAEREDRPPLCLFRRPGTCS